MALRLIDAYSVTVSALLCDADPWGVVPGSPAALVCPRVGDNSDYCPFGAAACCCLLLLACKGQVVALCAHCVGTACTCRETHPRSPATCLLAQQQSPQDNNQHMRGHIGPRAIRWVANLAPNTKLGEVQQDANRFVKGSPIAPPNIAIAVVPTVYTTETSAGSDGIAAQRQLSPHTNRYLVPWPSFEGGIFKEQ